MRQEDIDQSSETPPRKKVKNVFGEARVSHSPATLRLITDLDSWIKSQDLVSASGITRYNLLRLAYIAKRTERLSVYRSVNPDSRVAIEDLGAKGKRMTTKGKSSEFAMISGFIPTEPLLSKMFSRRDDKDELNRINYFRDLIKSEMESAQGEIDQIMSSDLSMDHKLQSLNAVVLHSYSKLTIKIDDQKKISRSSATDSGSHPVKYIKKSSSDQSSPVEICCSDNEGLQEPLFVIEIDGKVIDISGVDFNDPDFVIDDEYVNSHIVEVPESYVLQDIELVSYLGFEKSEDGSLRSVLFLVTADYDELTSGALQIFPLEAQRGDGSTLAEELVFLIDDVRILRSQNSQSPETQNPQSPEPQNSQSPEPQNSQSTEPQNSQSTEPQNPQSPEPQNYQAVVKMERLGVKLARIEKQIQDLKSLNPGTENYTSLRKTRSAKEQKIAELSQLREQITAFMSRQEPKSNLFGEDFYVSVNGVYRAADEELIKKVFVQARVREDLELFKTQISEVTNPLFGASTAEREGIKMLEADFTDAATNHAAEISNPCPEKFSAGMVAFFPDRPGQDIAIINTESEICDLTNDYRRKGYNVPVNPRWFWLRRQNGDLFVPGESGKPKWQDFFSIKKQIDETVGKNFLDDTTLSSIKVDNPHLVNDLIEKALAGNFNDFTTDQIELLEKLNPNQEANYEQLEEIFLKYYESKLATANLNILNDFIEYLYFDTSCPLYYEQNDKNIILKEGLYLEYEKYREERLESIKNKLEKSFAEYQTMDLMTQSQSPLRPFIEQFFEYRESNLRFAPQTSISSSSVGNIFHGASQIPSLPS